MDGRSRRALRAAVVVALVGAAAGWQTFAAFSSTTSNSGNSFSAGTVYVSDNDGGCAMYQAPKPGSGACSTVTVDAANKKPLDAVTGCYTVTYTGTLPAKMDMYWTPAAGGADTLSPYLNLKVEKGTSTTPFNDCTGFTAEATLYDSALSGFNTSASPHTAGFPGTATSWVQNDAVTYKFTVTLADNNAANNNGLGGSAFTTGSHDFTWLATNQ